MQIKLIAVGTKMPEWVKQAYQEYASRMPKICTLHLHEIAAKKRGKNADTERILQAEAQLMREAIPPQAKVISLERRGTLLNTQQLAKQMQQSIDIAQDMAILIGGPEGIHSSLLAQTEKWSLSKMVFAHPLIRVMLAEQLYRAWSINANLPYHRGQ